MGWDFIDMVRMDGRLAVVVDDNGLHKTLPCVTRLDGYPSPLAGNLLIIGTDEHGDTVDVAAGIDEIAGRLNRQAGVASGFPDAQGLADLRDTNKRDGSADQVAPAHCHQRKYALIVTAQTVGPPRMSGAPVCKLLPLEHHARASTEALAPSMYGRTR
jgi:hypothetical protein